MTVASSLQILRRFETRSTWVSTAIAGIPNASPNTTFAVFLPTPGRDINSSLDVGTCPSKRSISCCAHALMFFALFRYKPIVFILRMISSIEASANASGVGKEANKSGVALFTDTSVAWALKITAINNSNGLLCLSSPCASGNIPYIVSRASIVFCLLNIFRYSSNQFFSETFGNSSC